MSAADNGAAMRAAKTAYPDPSGPSTVGQRIEVARNRVAYINGFKEATRRASEKAAALAAQFDGRANDPFTPMRASAAWDDAAEEVRRVLVLGVATAPEGKG